MSLTRVQDVSVEDIYKRKKPRKHYVYSIYVYWQDGPITPVYRSYNTLLELQERLLRIKEFLQNQKEDEISTSLLKGQKLTDRFTIKKRAKALRRLPAVEEFLKAVVNLPSPISESDPVINFFHPLLDDLTELDYEQKALYYSLENVRRSSKPKNIQHISEPILVEQYLVVADYVKQEDSDISLKAGNVVDVIERNEHGWWFVDLDGEVGWAPASYLEPRDGSMDDQVLEVFEEGEEETYITTAAYEPELEDEIKLDKGKIVKVIQKNLDGWWLVKIEKNEGWAPAMFLREIATSRRNAREKGQHAVRAMLRDRLNSISAMTGRRQTWDPPKRKKSVKRNIPANGTDQTESRASIKPTYVNLEFHEAMKRQAAGRGRTRQKLDPNEVRAGARLQPSNGAIHDTENASNGSLKPRLLSMVEEESVEGTSPIPSPLLCRRSNPSNTPSSEDDVFCPIDLSERPAKEMGASDSLEDSNNETEENEGEEYTENMPELENNRFYAMGSYEKEDDEEVNLRENAEVEVLKESDGGWWLVRTSSHSVGWAPSNFLEKVQSLRRRSTDDTKGTELPEHDQTAILEVIPVRPPKSPRILKMARDMCIEKEFWQYIQTGEDKNTCLLDEREITNKIPSEEDTGKHQSHLDTKSDNKEVMAFTFDDYECDPNNNAPAQESLKDILEINNNVIERSESVPSLAESEDLDNDDDYEQIKI